MALKVGRTKIIDKKTHRERRLSYSDVEKDPDDWVDPIKYLPADYDLITLKTPKGSLAGWALGNTWDGIRVTETTEVLYWKKRDSVNEI